MIKNAISVFLQNKNSVMFITVIFFMTGILAYFNDIPIVCSAILTILCILSIWKNIIPIKYLILWICIFYFGFFNAYFKTDLTDPLVTFAPTKTSIEGQIVTIPNNTNSLKSKFFFDVNKIDEQKVTGKTFVTYTGEDRKDLQIGKHYKIYGKIQTPFKASNSSQFDYGKYLKNFNTFTVFYGKNSEELNTNLTPKWKFLLKLNSIRDKIINVHSKYLKSPNLEILGGIVFGDDAVSPPDYVKASFVNSGLLHILAASGMNVAFIYGFWVFFMKRLRVPFKLTVISGMGLIVLYTLMTGLGASVIRAALMLLFILFGKLIDRDAHSVSLLAFVAMLMLIYNPAFINNVGFQLSFIVTFGLLTTANVIFEKYKDSKIPQWLMGAILIPIIAQIWVAPIQMFYFNTFSTYSVLANLISMPFLSIISFLGFVSSIIASASPLTDSIAMFLDQILNFFLNILVIISNFFANLPFSLITTTHPNIFQIFMYYAIILLLTISVKSEFNKKIVIAIGSIFILLCLSLINIPNHNLQIITFDVQNADCFLIKTPQNKYFIIDTGRASFQGSKAQANSIIIKYLKDRGIKNIEGLIVTHFDNDHSGGTSDIMKNVKIKKIYLNSLKDTSMTSMHIYQTIKNLDIPTSIPVNNNVIYSEKDFQLKTYFADFETDNEKSIITLLSYKNFDMLFTGDAGLKAFNELKKDIPTNIEVLKVGHHGGPNVVDENMLKHLNTKVAIISTGQNSFGHPNIGTLDILRNTEVYRTDRHNAIEIKSNGNDYTLSTFDRHKKKFIKSKELIAN